MKMTTCHRKKRKRMQTAHLLDVLSAVNKSFARVVFAMLSMLGVYGIMATSFISHTEIEAVWKEVQQTDLLPIAYRMLLASTIIVLSARIAVYWFNHAGMTLWEQMRTYWVKQCLYLSCGIALAAAGVAVTNSLQFIRTPLLPWSVEWLAAEFALAYFGRPIEI